MLNSVQIVKAPEYEGDDFLLKLQGLHLAPLDFWHLECDDQYLVAKLKAFELKDIDKRRFEVFKDNRPSMRAYDDMEELSGSVYTYTVGESNTNSYECMMSTIKSHLEHRPTTRRCVVRVLQDYFEYFYSEGFPWIDVSCLSLIHYVMDGDKLSVRLVFRASDVKNELFTDIVSIYKYFVLPIAGDNAVDMTIYASTAQNVGSFIDYIRDIRENLIGVKDAGHNR
jgi:thymidylate synthase